MWQKMLQGGSGDNVFIDEQTFGAITSATVSFELPFVPSFLTINSVVGSYYIYAIWNSDSNAHSTSYLDGKIFTEHSSGWGSDFVPHINGKTVTLKCGVSQFLNQKATIYAIE